MSVDDQRDGRALFLTLVEEYSGKYDDGAVAMTAQDAMTLDMYTDLGPFRASWRKNNRAYLDSTGSAVLAGMQRRQLLETLRPHTHATTRDPPRAHGALAGLHSALMTKTLMTEQIFNELTIACNALAASDVDVLAGNKVGTDFILSAATTQGTKTCQSCHGRGTVEIIT